MILGAQLHKIRSLLEGRTVSEVHDRLSICYTCPSHKNNNCEFETILSYCSKLAVGHCPQWNELWEPKVFHRVRNKISITFHSFGLLCGGAERWLVDLATHLNKDLFNVCIAVDRRDCCDPYLVEKASKVDHLVFGRISTQSAMDASDIVLTWATFPKSKARHHIFCSHGCDKLTEDLADIYGDRTDYKFTAVSRAATMPWVSQKELSIIHNGVDANRVEPSVDRISARQILRLSADTIVIGYISRMVSEKNPQLVAKAAAQLTERGYKAKALYVCDKKPTNIEQNAIYIPRTEEIGNLLCAMDCFMLPSNSEAFSLAITEAWLAGVPVVATPVGVLPELDLTYGRMVTYIHNRTKLADYVLAAIADVKTTERAKRIATENFTLPKMVKRWEDYLCSLS